MPHMQPPAESTMLAIALTAEGHYCPPGTDSALGSVCPTGYYCDGGPADKIACNTAPGFYCPEGGSWLRV